MNNPLVFFLNTQGVFLLIAGAFAFLYFTEGFSEVLKHAFLVVLITLFTTVILKELFNTQRPFEVDPNLQVSAGIAYLSSFPSTHAALAFAVSTIIALHRRRLGVFLLVLSAFIAIGRVAASVHYPVDIIFGILIGVMVALFFDTFHVRVLKKKRHS